MAEKELPPDPYDKAIARARAEGRVEGIYEAAGHLREQAAGRGATKRTLIAAANRLERIAAAERVLNNEDRA